MCQARCLRFLNSRQRQANQMTVRILTILLLSVLSAGCFDNAVLNDAIEDFVERPTVSIAAWNIRIFSANSRDDQELMMIADKLGYRIF